MRQSTSAQLTSALSYWFQSWSFIIKHGLLHFFLYPIAIGILLSMGSIVFIKKGVTFLMQWIEPHLGYTPLADSGVWANIMQVLSKIGTYAVSFILWLLAIYLFSRIHKYVVLILLSPMMAILSERTEEKLTGTSFPFDGKQLIRDVVRGSLLALRNMVIELFLTLAIWIAGAYISLLMPPLGIALAPVFALLSFIIGAYFYGFSVMDYSNERHRLTIAQSIKKIREYRGLAIGTGAIFAFWTNIPLVGVTIASVTCTVAGTMAICDKK